MIQFRQAKLAQPTGTIFTSLLAERGLRIAEDGQAVVCYGLGYTGSKPALNANAGKYDKLQELEVMARAGISIPPTWTPEEGGTKLKPLFGGIDLSFPLLARKKNHMHGKDIMPVLQVEEIPFRYRAGGEFFTQYINRETEFRVWVYRRRHLATYQKVMKYPEKYRFIGCNYRNGFMFDIVRRENLPQPAIDLAAKAVQALQLDFGAVDVLLGKDGKFYVLEVNTAPGVQGLTREGINRLADKVVKWTQLNYPDRSTK
jgi:hypothetical protein